MAILYGDLNILHDPANPVRTVDTAKQAIRLGYDALAINVDIGDVLEEPGPSSSPSNAKKKRKLKLIPEPFRLPSADVDNVVRYLNRSPGCSEDQRRNRKFRQFTRISGLISDTACVHTFLKNEVVQQYDIVAICPDNEQIFNAVIKKPEVDLITFDSARRPFWINKGKLVRQAVDNGMGFELCYTPALVNSEEDRSMRRQVFSTARALHTITKGKGVLLSSGALDPMELRAPHDVANMSMAFGWSAPDGMRAISKHVLRILLRSQTKRTISGAMYVEPVTDTPPALLAQLMKIPAFIRELDLTKLNSKTPDNVTMAHRKNDVSEAKKVKL